MRCFTDDCQNPVTTTSLPAQSTTTTSIPNPTTLPDTTTSTLIIGTTTVPTVGSTTSLPQVLLTLPDSSSPTTLAVQVPAPNTTVGPTEGRLIPPVVYEAQPVAPTGELPATGYATGTIGVLGCVAVVLGVVFRRFRHAR